MVKAAAARAVAVGAVAACAHGAQGAAGQPNLVLLVVDDLGWADLGFRSGDGDAHIRTPVLDSLAADGVVLNRHYSYNWCGPSRASLMTGPSATSFGSEC